MNRKTTITFIYNCLLNFNLPNIERCVHNQLMLANYHIHMYNKKKKGAKLETYVYNTSRKDKNQPPTKQLIQVFDDLTMRFKNSVNVFNVCDFLKYTENIFSFTAHVMYQFFLIFI